MSFVKHAIFVGEDAPSLDDYENISDYILNRISSKRLMISEGVCDALDHASPNALFGGKLGVDCTLGEVEVLAKNIIDDSQLLQKAQLLVPEITALKQYKTTTKTPITIIAIEKNRAGSEIYELLKPLREHIKLLVIVDSHSNSVSNPYMLIWRAVNNIDAQRDIFIEDEYIGIDATNKSKLDGYNREWPKDTNCDQDVISSLIERGLIKESDEFLKYYHIK